MELIVMLAVLVLVGGGIFLISLFLKIAKSQKRIEWLKNQRYTVIRIDVPRNNEKAPLAAEQMFAAIHGVYADSALFQYQLSFEIVARDKYIQFFVFIPVHLKDFIEGQIYAQYPTVEIHQVDDYADLKPGQDQHFCGAELLTTKPDVYPIKLFSDFEVDPISGITSVMSKLNPGEQIWLQIIISPVGDEWQEKGNSLINAIRSGKSVGTSGTAKSIVGGLGKFGKLVFNQAVRPGYEEAPAENKAQLPGQVEDALKNIEMKIMKLGFATKIRILSISNDPVSARVKTNSVGAAYKQYNTTYLNGFKIGELKVDDVDFWREYLARTFEDNGNIFNNGELASIFHFPHQTVSTPNIVWSGSKKGEPPANLPLIENTPPSTLTTLGETNFRNINKKFGIKLDDRRRHIYIIGKSGVGKSVLMENMALDDVWEGRGVIVVDPHGEFAEKVLACIPDNRKEDVVVFDPADRAFPVAFNLLEHVEDDFKGMVASGFVGIFKKIFGYSWGPRLEHILRNTVLALLDYPESTMLDIPKMLTETRFREKVISHILDPVIRDFWVMEFAQYDSKFRTEAVSPILNKVGQFLATATIRNIVGQPHSTLNIREIMDQKNIMVVNLSRGKIGEDNSALLGAMMITKIQLAAMSRADVTVDKRTDCYLYVDEFQNFATESFAVILSEARKYCVNLTIANQYITQMPEEVRDAVFGNAGTIISFRIGGTDADFLVKEFEPVFENNDLVNLDKYHIYIKLLVDGIASPAFSGQTLPPSEKITGNAEEITELSRKRYSKPRALVEQKIADRTLKEQQEMMAEAEAFKSGGLAALLTKKDKDEGEQKVNYNHDSKHDQNEQKVEKPVGESQVRERGEIEVKKNQSSEKPREEKSRILKYQNIIGDSIYKEQTARGGVRWYIGEPIDQDKLVETDIEITEPAKKMIDLAHKTASKSDREKSNETHKDYDGRNEDRKTPTLQQNIVETHKPENKKEECTQGKENQAVTQDKDQSDGNLEEGRAIKL